MSPDPKTGAYTKRLVLGSLALGLNGVLRRRKPLPSCMCSGGRHGRRQCGKKSRVYSNIAALNIVPENRIITMMVTPLSESKSPLARLVLFMVCLSIAGVFVSGVYTYTVELPQKSLTAPENAYDMYKMNDCLKECNEKYLSGTNEGVLARSYCYRACTAQYGR